MTFAEAIEYTRALREKHIIELSPIYEEKALRAQRKAELAISRFAAAQTTADAREGMRGHAALLAKARKLHYAAAKALAEWDMAEWVVEEINNFEPEIYGKED